MPATTWSFTNVPTSFLFDRGYTGHEHLDNFGLINMPALSVAEGNGRVYDPAIARFLSPDPILQNPRNTQSHNRYSYCLNNPLKYTDPSGYIQKPVGWNDPLPWIPWYGGGAASYANNNWYSQYRTEDQNYVMMGSRAFNNMYGPGASDIASKLISNPSTFNAWRQGLISIDQVRRNGGNSNMGPSAGLVGEPGKSVIENQYGRWEYNEQGIWVQTVIKLNAVTSAAGQGGGNIDAAAFIVGVTEFYYNLGVDANPKASGGAKGVGMGLTGLSIILGVLQLYDQYTIGGIKNVCRADATNVSIGTVGIAAKGLSWYGIGGKIVSFTGEAAGFVGIALTIYQLWGNIYKPMNDLNYVPSYILPNGEPVYGNPVSGDQW